MPSPHQPDNASVFSRLTALETTLSSFGQRMGGLEGKMDSIQTAISSSKQTNWSLVIASLTLGGAIIAGIYTSLSSKTELWSMQSRSDMMTYVQPIVAAAEQSRADRANLHERTESNGERLSLLESKQAAAEAALGETLKELESQMRNIGNIVNITKDNQEVVNSLLWKKAYGEDLPQTSFRPEMHRQR